MGRLAIAVPVFDSADNIIGSILAVANPAIMTTDQLRSNVLPVLLEATARIRGYLPIYR